MAHHHAKCLQIVLGLLVGGCREVASGQNGLPCKGCWSLHDTPTLWCCTWPSINKQMRGSLWRSEELSWPICHRSLSAHWDPEWPPAVSACQTAANLVFGDGQEGRRGEGGGALGWRHTKRWGGGAWVATAPPFSWLVWVTKWCRESTWAFIINLSGSNRIPSILAPQSFCPPSCSPTLRGGSPCLCGCGESVRREGRGLQSSGIVQLLLFNYAPFSSQLKDHDIIIT